MPFRKIDVKEEINKMMQDDPEFKLAYENSLREKAAVKKHVDNLGKEIKLEKKQ